MVNNRPESPLSGWDHPVQTSIGPVQWRRLAPPFGGRQIWYGMVLDGEADGALVGFLSVDDPSTVDEDTRRATDPIDLRIDTIWVHPQLRGRGIGTAMQTLARDTAMFDSHSLTRTKAGSRLAATVDGADPDEVTEVPDAEDFDRGAQRSYERIIATNSACRAYVTTE